MDGTLAETLYQHGVVPVIALDRAADALPVAAALRDGGLPVAEVTFRTEAAADAIARIRDGAPDVLVGAGTVLRPDQADAAAEAGAAFVVTPGFNPRVVDHCLERGLAVVPGIATPGELEQALERGISLVKFFPAEALGGVAFLRAVAGPYPTARFVPTGGLRPEHLAAYLAVPSVVACGGSWLVARQTVDAADWGEIANSAAAAVEAVRALRR